MFCFWGPEPIGNILSLSSTTLRTVRKSFGEAGAPGAWDTPADGSLPEEVPPFRQFMRSGRDVRPGLGPACRFTSLHGHEGRLKSSFAALPLTDIGLQQTLTHP